MRRAILAALLLVGLTTGTVRAEVEEVEHFESLEAITEGSDAVVLGHVVDVEPGRVFSGCGYAAATLHVDALLAGTLPSTSRDQLILEYFGFCGDMADVEQAIPSEPGVFFLRNKGTDTRMFRPDATQAEIAVESGFWRTVILAGTVINQNGTVEVPETLNAPFLAELRGLPFDAFVDEVQTIGGLPHEPAADPDAGFSLPEPILALAAIVAALLGAVLLGRRLLARRV